MAIPVDWLLGPIRPAEVEEEVAELGAPDLWLRQWRALLGRSAPGDEVWEYCEPPELESVGGLGEYHLGFALVRGGEILDWIETPDSIA